MSGFDHDFLFLSGANEIVRAFVRCLERRWGSVVIGDGVNPIDGWLSDEEGWSSEDVRRASLFVSESLELRRWSDENGAISDPSGKSDIMILIFPQGNGAATIDIVTAEEWRNADAGNTWISDVFDDFFRAVAESQQCVTNVEQSLMCLRVQCDVDWLIRSISAIVPSGWSARRELVESSGGVGSEIAVDGDQLVILNAMASVIAELEVRRETGITEISVSEWGDRATEVERDTLQKVIYRSVGMWHHVYFVDDGERRVTTRSCPPGELELINGCVAIRGTGCRQ